MSEAEEKAPTAKAAPAKAKKEAPPAKPFEAVINEDVIPAAIAGFKERGVSDVELVLDSLILKGSFGAGTRQFNVIFSAADLNAAKAYTYSADGAPISQIESFMIDERKVPPELFVFYLLQRVYAQKWY